MSIAPTVIVIQGPTAVGKTAIAIAVAQLLNTEIVSADSRQCYVGMAIGTAQPSPIEMAAVKHHFINEYPVTQEISAADYEDIALRHIAAIHQHSPYAVVCGGTGLYIKALCEGLDAMPQTSKDIEANIEAAYNQNGISWLQNEIQSSDPEFYNKGEIHNPARLIRALAFVKTNNESILRYRTGIAKTRPFRILKVGLEMPRELLYQRINTRVEMMLSQGLINEVKELLPYKELKNLQTVGYTEIFNYLDGNCTLNEAIEKIKQHSRNYAKRQMTWFKKDTSTIWLNPSEPRIAQQIANLATSH